MRRSSVVLAALGGVLAIVVSACGSSDDGDGSGSTTLGDLGSLTITTPTVTSPATLNPADYPGEPTRFDGATGSVAVTLANRPNVVPRIQVSTPFTVTTTEVHVLKAGTGPVVPSTATVEVHYLGVNGRDGQPFDSSYQGGEPASFPLDGVIPGFTKGIAGQKVGSSVLVAVAPADGYTQGEPSAGIEPGDTLIFEITILDAG
ncbi:MAG: FKBP-type peptidyl-prolyl cis-trans isomerase [Gordonia sp. (in: high G+C Gram-positive bacteria)]